MFNNQFCRDVEELRKMHTQIGDYLSTIENNIKSGNIQDAYAESYKLEAVSERFTSLSRLLPIATGDKKAFAKVNKTITDEAETKIGYTEQGWFVMHIPSLLPKKEKGSATYIRATVQAAMNSYFTENRHDKFNTPSVLIFEHIYSANRKKREYRDHDNIEINVIVDLVALYCLVDDSPMLCRHYYTSKQGEQDSTNVYIVPAEDFQFWLQRSEN